MATFAVAAPYFHPDGHNIVDSCNTGAVQCCDQIFPAESEQANWLGGLVGATVGAITAGVGLSCVPITVIGVGSGGQCASQPVCCTENHMNGLVTLGCNPINVNV
ncbi:fungal hydrophobin [Agrocybe pediades]|nr:fungal hydrophobin [Agrocybe pediades]